MTTMLNIAECASGVTVLGPGKRSVLWTQGCVRKCRACWSPEWQPLTAATLIEPEALALVFASSQDDSGLTISGGEPMLQAKGLAAFWNALKRLRPDWSLILFSGYYREEILLENNEERVRFLKMADCFIGGPYVEALNNGKGLRGSTNKDVYFSLANSFTEEEKRIIKDGPRSTQWQQHRGALFRIGVPDPSMNASKTGDSFPDYALQQM